MSVPQLLFLLLTIGTVFTTPLNAGRASPTPPASVLPPALDAWCNQLSHDLRSVNQGRCEKRSWKFEMTSTGGRPIPYLYWGKDPSTPPSAEQDPRRVLIFGAMHGDEISAVSAVFRWIDFLERTKPDSFLRKHVYMFFPLVNPDGFYSNPRSRTNSAGVDINRNFSTKEWNEQATLFWKKKASGDPRRFPGPKAASERETQVVEKAINEFKPDLIISVHAPYSLVDHDGPIAFPEMQSPLPIRTLGAYPGSLGTYAGIERNIPVVTPELPNARQLPEGKAIEQLFIFIMKS
ncbi:MAG: succinylglutamate desuccinylase/aspartoacylase family protein, partial [Deltaproteobacteria bacterium]|nr:succinylglutamate desuccinylase/aspartoacylase family protein [Deltaproteobacteria bacterium]